MRTLASARMGGVDSLESSWKLAAGGQTVASFKCHEKKLGFLMQGKEMLRVAPDTLRVVGPWVTLED